MRRFRFKKNNNKIIHDNDEVNLDENIHEKNDEEINSKKKIITENIYKFLIKTSTFLLKSLIISSLLLISDEL